jgi:hypothetical protein
VETVTEINAADGDLIHRFPRWVPGANAIVFSVYTGGHADDGRIELVDVSTGARKVLIEPGVDARVLPGGLLVFGRHPNLMVSRFDETTMAPVGDSVQVDLAVEAAARVSWRSRGTEL